jgi:F0F1-type ATP synthase, subunit b
VGSGAAPVVPTTDKGCSMPQLDSATWLSQIVWLAITFVVLLILMWGVALPKVRRTLEDRQTKIDGDLREAERLRDEANAALNAYEKALEEARSKAHAIATEMSAKVAEEAN